MSVSYGKAVLFKCSRCGDSLERFKVKNAWIATATTNMKYCCPSCNRRYESEGWFSLIYSFLMLPLFLIVVNYIYYTFGDSLEADFLTAMTSIIVVLLLSFYLYGVFKPLMPLENKE